MYHFLSVPTAKSSCVLGLLLALLGGPCDARHCTWCSSPLVISLIFLKPLASHQLLTGLASVSLSVPYIDTVRVLGLTYNLI